MGTTYICSKCSESIADTENFIFDGEKGLKEKDDEFPFVGIGDVNPSCSGIILLENPIYDDDDIFK